MPQLLPNLELAWFWDISRYHQIRFRVTWFTEILTACTLSKQSPHTFHFFIFLWYLFQSLWPEAIAWIISSCPGIFRSTSQVQTICKKNQSAFGRRTSSLSNSRCAVCVSNVSVLSDYPSHVHCFIYLPLLCKTRMGKDTLATMSLLSYQNDMALEDVPALCKSLRCMFSELRILASAVWRHSKIRHDSLQGQPSWWNHTILSSNRQEIPYRR